jgi:beta-glucanase (GH16 family)
LTSSTLSTRLLTLPFQEILGAYDKQAQSNYFFDGRPVYDQYADTYDLDFSTTADFHTYSIEWSDKFLIFSVDGKELKTWRNGDIPGDQWPQLPMQVKVGVWAVTEDSAPGEIEWAGGVPNWGKNAPFVAYYRKLVVEDYAAWCHKRSGNITYDWDNGARWEDVRLTGCERRGGSGFFPDEDDPWPTSETEQSSATRTSPNESQDVSSKAPSSTDGSNNAGSTKTSATAEPSNTDTGEEDVAASPKASGLFAMFATLVWLFALW